MITIDTNVLLRILVDDPKQSKQVNAARSLAQKAKKVFIPQIVQVETVWVLESCYKLKKADILSILYHLMNNSAFDLQNHEQFQLAIQLLEKYNLDFSDCLITAVSIEYSPALFTFDKKLSRLKHVKLVKLN